MVREEERERARPLAREHAEERLLDVLLPPSPRGRAGSSAASTSTSAIPMPAIGDSTFSSLPPPASAPPTSAHASPSSDGAGATRESLRKLLRDGKLDDRMVEIDTADTPQSVIDVFSGTGMEEMVLNLKDMLPQGGRRTKRRRLSVPEALEALTDEEAGKLIDVDKLTKEAIRRAEEAGIIFIDDHDKVAGREGCGHGGPAVSREGV
jgi:ATP-dependent HslUV protease ATP-binding subunit HslU